MSISLSAIRKGCTVDKAFAYSWPLTLIIKVPLYSLHYSMFGALFTYHIIKRRFIIISFTIELYAKHFHFNFDPLQEKLLSLRRSLPGISELTEEDLGLKEDGAEEELVPLVEYKKPRKGQM